MSEDIQAEHWLSGANMLSETRQVLSPNSDELSSLIAEHNSQFWKQPPLPHEYALVSAFATLSEKGRYHSITSQDVLHASRLISYVSTLNEQQVNINEFPARKSPLPLFRSDIQQSLQTHTSELADTTRFMSSPQWQRRLTQIFGSYVHAYEEHTVLQPGSFSQIHQTVEKFHPEQ